MFRHGCILLKRIFNLQQRHGTCAFIFIQLTFFENEAIRNCLCACSMSERVSSFGALMSGADTLLCVCRQGTTHKGQRVHQNLNFVRLQAHKRFLLASLFTHVTCALTCTVSLLQNPLFQLTTKLRFRCTVVCWIWPNVRLELKQLWVTLLAHFSAHNLHYFYPSSSINQ
jgi:hypothetical protein